MTEILDPKNQSAKIGVTVGETKRFPDGICVEGDGVEEYKDELSPFPFDVEMWRSFFVHGCSC